jgi:NO-binding membrane sensor protein with MHYT domain
MITEGTVNGLSYGMVTPVAAFVMATLGAALGLRCTVRSFLVTGPWKQGWLALGAMAIGTGIWSMHFIAMMGFTVTEVPIHYDAPITFASLGLAVVVVGIGTFIVGNRGATPQALFTGGVITGLGVAAMHYLGMASMRFRGELVYNTTTVTISVLIAVVASTVALWFAVSVRGLWPAIGAAVVMGVAVSGMHYTGMAALGVHLHGVLGETGGTAPATLLAPMMIGPVCFLFLAGVVVIFDPMVVLGSNERAVAVPAGTLRDARRD